MPEQYWQKQTKDQPLYADLLWSRPESRQLAGKLLVVGGNQYGFAAPADAYHTAEDTGAGSVRVLVPDALKKVIGRVFQAGEFAPSTPSGSFSQKALAELLAMSDWADCTLLAGDLGHNSETAILLEKYTQKYHGKVVITKDAADYFTLAPEQIVARPDTLLVLSFAQLQKLASGARFTPAFTFSMDLWHVVETLHKFEEQFSIGIITKHLDYLIAAADGRVSTTQLNPDQDIWRVKTATRAAVWWLQNPAKQFEALSSAIYESAQTDHQ